MSYTKRFFELLDEVKLQRPDTFTTDQKIMIVSFLLEEENKDRRTEAMSKSSKPTEKQIEFLKSKNYTNFDGMTKAEATEKIKEIIERGKK